MGKASDETENCRCALVFLDHDFRRLDYGNHCVSLFQFQFVSAAAGNGAFNEIVSDPYNDMRHDVAQLDFLDCST